MTKNKRSCSVIDCNKKHVARGFCQTHYMRLKRTGSVGNSSIQVRGTEGCLIDDCTGFHIARGFCQRHYTIYDRYRLSVEQINNLPTQCDFCSSEENLQIDHDHSCCDTKRLCGNCVRRVLCKRCNTGIGHLGNDPDLYLKIAEKLKNNPNPRLHM